MTSPKFEALLFDVFGTVVDWRGSIAHQAAAFAEARGIPEVDWNQFALDWRALYQPAMEPIRSGERPYTKLDVLHRENLDQIVEKYGFSGLPEAEIDDLNRVWHWLDPWPDAVEGLALLKTKYIIGPHSNGNISLMVDMAKNAGLPWDVILGAEVAHAYKPTPESYDRCCAALDRPPAQVMMVAAHNGDLRAARARGMRTAFVARPTEYATDQTTDLEAEEDWDYVAESFVVLARQLGC